MKVYKIEGEKSKKKIFATIIAKLIQVIAKFLRLLFCMHFFLLLHCYDLLHVSDRLHYNWRFKRMKISSKMIGKKYQSRRGYTQYMIHILIDLAVIFQIGCKKFVA